MKTLFLIACFAVGWILAGVKPVKSQTGFSVVDANYLVLRRIEVKTNVMTFQQLSGDWIPFGTNVVTNCIIGTATKDLFRAQVME